MLGTKDARRDDAPSGDPDGSPRSDELDDFFISAGEEARDGALLRLMTLELRRNALGGMLGGRGGWRGSGGSRGDLMPGERGWGVFALV